MIKTKISGIQQVQAALRKEVEKLTDGDKYVLVGYPETVGDHPDGESIAFVAAANQFGTDTIPARPFLDVGVASVEKEINTIAEEGIAEVYDGKSTITDVLNRIGITAVGGVQKTITEIKSPANAISTIKNKKSANPLIDTGVMRQATTYILSKDKPKEGI